MALNMSRRKKTGNDDIPMAPMIDCVFLLLIFFMVSVVMRVPPPFTVTLPDSATQHEFTREKYNLYIDSDGRISIGDQEMLTLKDMELFVAAHKNQISTLIIRADKPPKHEIVIEER